VGPILGKHTPKQVALEWYVVDSGKYLGVTINKDLTWTKHINQTIGKASKTLGFLRRNLGRCTTKTKATAYTTLVRPVLEYASESIVSSCSGVPCCVIVGWFSGNQLMVDLVAHYKGLF
jgi:hypothetical protein